MLWSSIGPLIMVSVVTMIDAEAEKCKCVCAGPRVKDFRIVGGTVAEGGEFPWIVWIKLGQKENDFCAGSLITHRHVLTAAHCLLDIVDFSVLELYLGVHNTLDATGPHRAVRVTTHDDFIDDEEQNLPNDIAIIQLDDTIDFSGNIRPACLPSDDDGDYESGEATVAGWGMTSEKGTFTKVLHKVLLPFVSKTACNTTFPALGNGAICAGYEQGQRDACQGDSGGPLHIINEAGMYELVGLVSFGEGCARPHKPAVFTRVPFYLDWIQQHIGAECLCYPLRTSAKNRDASAVATVPYEPLCTGTTDVPTLGIGITSS